MINFNPFAEAQTQTNAFEPQQSPYVPSTTTSQLLTGGATTPFSGISSLAVGLSRQQQEQEVANQQAIANEEAARLASEAAMQEQSNFDAEMEFNKSQVKKAVTPEQAGAVADIIISRDPTLAPQRDNIVAGIVANKITNPNLNPSKTSTSSDKGAEEARRIQTSMLMKNMPTAKQKADAVGSVNAHNEAISLLDSITGNPNDPESTGLLSSTTTGITGGLRSLAEPVAGWIGREDVLPPTVTRIEDKSELLLASARRALAGVGVTSDRDTKQAEKIISSINWKGSEATIREKLKNLRDFLIARNKAATEIISSHDTAKESLAGLIDEARGGSVQQAPVSGAKQAPDGNWYVEINGAFFKVNQ